MPAEINLVVHQVSHTRTELLIAHVRACGVPRKEEPKKLMELSPFWKSGATCRYPRDKLISADHAEFFSKGMDLIWGCDETEERMLVDERRRTLSNLKTTSFAAGEPQLNLRRTKDARGRRTFRKQRGSCPNQSNIAAFWRSG